MTKVVPFVTVKKVPLSQPTGMTPWQPQASPLRDVAPPSPGSISSGSLGSAEPSPSKLVSGILGFSFGGGQITNLSNFILLLKSVISFPS